MSNEIEKVETYAPGDLLKKTPHYAGQYPGWSATTGTALSVKMVLITDAEMGAVDKAMFRARYGYQKEYPLFDMIVDCDDGKQYRVSQFGFNKEGV